MSETRTIVIKGREVIVDGSQIKLDTLDLYFPPEEHRSPMSQQQIDQKRLRAEILKTPTRELENLIL